MNLNAVVRRIGALMGLVLTGLILALAGAGAAAADGGGSMDVTDTHHISIHDYQMSFNEGAGKVLGVVATPGTSIPASFHQLMAAATKAIAELAFMPYKAATHLDILTPAVKAAEKVSTSISSQFGEGFLVTVVGSTALLTVVIFALRNHKGQAWHHIAITLACMGVGVVITLPVGRPRTCSSRPARSPSSRGSRSPAATAMTPPRCWWMRLCASLFSGGSTVMTWIPWAAARPGTRRSTRSRPARWTSPTSRTCPCPALAVCSVSKCTPTP